MSSWVYECVHPLTNPKPFEGQSLSFNACREEPGLLLFRLPPIRDIDRWHRKTTSTAVCHGLNWAEMIMPLTYAMQLTPVTKKYGAEQGRFIHKAEEAEASGPTKPTGPPRPILHNTENSWENKMAITIWV